MSVRELGRRMTWAFWFPLPETTRVEVLPAERPAARAEIARARATLAEARRSGPGEAQNALALQALHGWLAVVGRASCEVGTDPGGTPAAADFAAIVRAGAGRVRQSMFAAPRISMVIDRYGATDCAVPTEPTVFRELATACEWTDLLVDARSPREQRLWAQLAAACAWPRSIVLGGAVVLTVTLAVLLAPKNLALGKNVTASSICPYTPPPPLRRHTLAAAPLGRLVDGVTVEGPMSRVEWAHGNFAACTNVEVHPWITIDLGADHTVDEVVVYNRSDCCWGADDTPLDVQLSDDNRNFVTVASRELPFTDDFPWRASFARRRARYVRLYNPLNLPKSLVLSEIEVHGR